MIVTQGLGSGALVTEGYGQLYGRRIIVSAGAVTTTGVGVVLKRALRSIAQVGNFALTGVVVVLKRGFRIVAAALAITFTGIAMTVLRGLRLAGSALAVPFVGIFANLFRSGEPVPTPSGGWPATLIRKILFPRRRAPMGLDRIDRDGQGKDKGD